MKPTQKDLVLASLLILGTTDAKKPAWSCAAT
jgi:hypothetical protein